MGKSLPAKRGTENGRQKLGRTAGREQAENCHTATRPANGGGVNEITRYYLTCQDLLAERESDQTAFMLSHAASYLIE